MPSCDELSSSEAAMGESPRGSPPECQVNKLSIGSSTPSDKVIIRGGPIGKTALSLFIYLMDLMEATQL